LDKVERRDRMNSSRRSPDGGSSVARNTEIEFCGPFCALGGLPIRLLSGVFHTVSGGTFSEVRLTTIVGSSSQLRLYSAGLLM
jgi:hypothetical protein